jgi:FkbM family methyltransferase
LGTGGAALGALGHRYWTDDPHTSKTATPSPPAEPGLLSFAQSGEDIITGFLFDCLGIHDITYLDIGAYDPILINNTYYFYKKGHRGVLVEPNVTMCEKLRAVRPEDIVIEAGIGVDTVSDAEYYVMSEPSWSTFSREEAEHQERTTSGEITIEEVRRIPLITVNDVMEKHFDGAPTFLSIDAEGWHIAILESIDYERFRPPAICVETLISDTNDMIPEIPAFMKSRGYVVRGGSFVNTIFVDSSML